MLTVELRIDHSNKVEVKSVLAKGFWDFFYFEGIKKIRINFDVTFDLLTNSCVENVFYPVLKLNRLLVYCPSADHEYFIDKFIPLTIFDGILQGT
jgi:hypothetical protein